MEMGGRNNRQTVVNVPLIHTKYKERRYFGNDTGAHQAQSVQQLCVWFSANCEFLYILFFSERVSWLTLILDQIKFGHYIYTCFVLYNY
jgi:hypothetical protein